MLEITGVPLDVSLMHSISKVERVCFLLIKTYTNFLGKIRKISNSKVLACEAI